ncbi:MAG: hypothetical protein HUU50_12100 [Candidatus Brocadiae bacterium]|nr:hypothetical protein [Candidatus Brocadiia bacterium]
MKINTLHLSMQELVLLSQGTATPELQQKAQKHCHICIICRERQKNLQQGTLSVQEKEMLQQWIKAQKNLKTQEAPSSQKQDKILPIPFLWEGQTNDHRVPTLCAAAASSPEWENLLYKSLRPHIPAKENLQTILNHLNQLRIMFSIYEGSLYIEFLQVSLPVIRRIISQIHIGSHVFSAQQIDNQGGLCLGKISSKSPSGEDVLQFSPQDLQNIRLEIRIEEA